MMPTGGDRCILLTVWLRRSLTKGVPAPKQGAEKIFAPVVLEIFESLQREIGVPPVGYGALDVRAELSLLDAHVFKPTVFAWV